jgi:hypothetical protein
LRPFPFFQVVLQIHGANKSGGATTRSSFAA